MAKSKGLRPIRKKTETKASINREIREAIDEINTRTLEYRELMESEGMEINEAYARRYEQLYTRGLSEVENTSFGTRLKPAFYKVTKGKIKGIEQLRIQRNELKDFLEFDEFSPASDRDYENRLEQAYNTFLERSDLTTKEFSKYDWEEFSNQFNKIKEHVREYGYEDKGAGQAYKEAYLRLDSNERRSFGEIVRRSYNKVLSDYGTVTYKSILKEFNNTIKDMKKHKEILCKEIL